MPAIEEVSWSSDGLQVTVLPEIGCRVHRLPGGLRARRLHLAPRIMVERVSLSA